MVTHDMTLDTHTLLLLSYHMIWRKYDAHVASLYFYRFHIYGFLFTETFCFEYFGCDPCIFLNNNHAMKIVINV